MVCLEQPQTLLHTGRTGTDGCQGMTGTTWPAQRLHPRNCPPSNLGCPHESWGGALLFLELGRDIPGRESEVKEQSRVDMEIALLYSLSEVAGGDILTTLILPALPAGWTLLSPGLPGHLTPSSGDTADIRSPLILGCGDRPVLCGMVSSTPGLNSRGARSPCGKQSASPKAHLSVTALAYMVRGSAGC